MTHTEQLFGTTNKTISISNQLLDQNTPINEPLMGKYTKSFGYHTLLRRMPDIFSVVINLLKTDPIESPFAQTERDQVVEKLKILLTDILTNESLRKIDGTSKLSIMWNEILDEKFNTNKTGTWFETEWLFAENYMYMRIQEAIENTKNMQNYDLFKQLKDKAFGESENTMIAIAKFLLTRHNKDEVNTTKLKLYFEQMIKISLWGNRFDLSLNIRNKSTNFSEDPLEAIVSLDKYILANDIDDIWNTLNVPHNNAPKRIDIIMDNSAYELFTDLCLADFFITYGLADVVVFHVKSIPWYVSDVTKLDYSNFLNRLEKECTSKVLQTIGNRWNILYKAGKFVVECEEFWTLPYDYSKMVTKDIELYKKLSKSQLLIFKGDLNYRKLIGDINWLPSTTFKDALRGFQPTSIVALRTLKCDCVCGLSPGYENNIEENDNDNNYLYSSNYWQVSGKYAVVQFNK
ncbi:Hypothetical protein CINCED_3A024917 [Cinara cedri]|uniref:Sugar phosphate phosphatase n=1 Tax=Cinara cedri TaxID=506608 RepID=A0A5E4N689_9HEMI|nr:Hypothetical protein CINCED_3A024917 [Cinara cedri]